MTVGAEKTRVIEGQALHRAEDSYPQMGGAQKQARFPSLAMLLSWKHTALLFNGVLMCTCTRILLGLVHVQLQMLADFL